MVRYIAKRLLEMIPVLLGLTLILFLLFSGEGEKAAYVRLGDNASPEMIDEWCESRGLNDPILVQYARYIYNIVIHQDFGNSYITDESVATGLAGRFPATFKLALVGAVVMLVVGIPVGVFSAVKQYSWQDTAVVSLSMVGVSIPNFWLALMLIIIFSLKLKLLPASGFYGPSYWILPAVAVSLNPTCTLMRTTRSSVLEAIRQDYVRTARAKGQKESQVIIHHVVRNALIPVMTVAGLQFGILLGGAVVIESIFSIPGLGKYITDSIIRGDMMVVLGGLMLIAFVFSIVNLLVDILYTYIDPRLKTTFVKKRKTS